MFLAGSAVRTPHAQNGGLFVFFPFSYETNRVYVRPGSRFPIDAAARYGLDSCSAHSQGSEEIQVTSV